MHKLSQTHRLVLRRILASGGVLTETSAAIARGLKLPPRNVERALARLRAVAAIETIRHGRAAPEHRILDAGRAAARGWSRIAGDDVAACGSRDFDHRAGDCADCRAIYERRRRVPLSERKKPGRKQIGPPPCGATELATHRRRTCAGCNAIYAQRGWVRRAARVNAARRARPAVQTGCAKARAKLRRAGKLRQCAGDPRCSAQKLQLVYCDYGEGYVAQMACKAHFADVEAAARAEAKARALQQLEGPVAERGREETNAAPMMTYDIAVAIAERLGVVEQAAAAASRHPSLPVAVPVGSPLYRSLFTRFVQRHAAE